jgi:glycosyltransferase involved in cell wall biosynthesis
MILSQPDRASRQRLRILVESYECSPVRGHAPGSAWQILSRLSQWFDIWVITEQSQYQKEIDDYLASHPDWARFLHFHYIPRDNIKGFGRQRPPLPLREIRDYRNWLKKSCALAAELDSQLDFDLVHHLRSNTFREPGLLWTLDKPSIWGPVGGSYCVPNCLLSFLNPANRLRYSIRNLVNRLQFAYSPKVKEAFKAASVILAQTSSDAEQIRHIHRRKAVLCHEQGIGQFDVTVRAWDGLRPLKIVWAARCIAGKALSILLQTLEKLNEPQRVELHIIGDGVELKRWQQEAIRRKVNNRCVWHGWKKPQETRRIISQADIAAITSILDGTSATIMEYLAAGLPVIALKHCGFKDVLDSNCGFLIPCREKNQIIHNFHTAITDLLNDPGRLAQMSQAALQRGQLYTWDRIVEKIRDVYYSTLHRTHMLDPLSCLQPVESDEAECQTAASHL